MTREQMKTDLVLYPILYGTDLVERLNDAYEAANPNMIIMEAVARKTPYALNKIYHSIQTKDQYVWADGLDYDIDEEANAMILFPRLHVPQLQNRRNDDHRFVPLPPSVLDRSINVYSNEPVHPHLLQELCDRLADALRAYCTTPVPRAS